jgi:hypothetical protein
VVPAFGRPPASSSSGAGRCPRAALPGRRRGGLGRRRPRLAAAGVPPEQARQALTAARRRSGRSGCLEPPSKNTDLALASSTAFALLFFLTTFLFGMAIAQSVVEEKQSRIVEILVAAVPVRVLLAGKVLGNTALALGQIALFVAVGLAGASVAGQSGLVSLLLRSSLSFLIFFLLGFLLLACLWAAAGALANRQEDLQATTMPLQVLVFVPFFAAAYVYTPWHPAHDAVVRPVHRADRHAAPARPRRRRRGGRAPWPRWSSPRPRSCWSRWPPDLRALAAALGRPPRLGRGARPRPAARHPRSRPGRSLT